jgi:hypothetical protein
MTRLCRAGSMACIKKNSISFSIADLPTGGDGKTRWFKINIRQRQNDILRKKHVWFT